MARVRHEINLQNGTWASGDTAGRVQLDTTQYNGTLTYYFEVVAKVSSGGGTASLDIVSGSNQVTIGSITATTYTLYRSASFTPTSATADMIATISGGVGATLLSSRIVVIQEATTLTNTETQIEIGNKATTTSTTNVATTNPKYWFYEDGNWDGTQTVYFEATIACASTKSATTAVLQVSDSSSIAAPTWSDVASSTITTTSTTGARVRSGAITLTADRWYRVVFRSGTSKSAASLFNAKVIIDQEGTIDQSITGNIGTQTIYGSTGTNEAEGQSFTAGSTYSVSNIAAFLIKTGSPSDNLSMELLSGSITGTSLGTSSNISATTVGTTASFIVFEFSSPIALTSGTKYYARITRSGSRDTSNFVAWAIGGAYANGESYQRDSGVWSPTGVGDHSLKVFSAGITKLEPQYLLANTLFAAGTSLQTFLTDWDSTEWDDGAGSITYYFQAEAANGSTSDVTLEEADAGGTVTNSTLTNIDNAQISSALTMPSDQNLDTKATTNAGDVAAARILVQYVFAPAAAAFIAKKPYIVNQAVNRSNTY